MYAYLNSCFNTHNIIHRFKNIDKLPTFITAFKPN